MLIQDLITVVHTSVLSAHESLADANLKLVEKYFEPIPKKDEGSVKDTEELEKEFHEALAQVSFKDTNEARKNISDIFEKFQNKTATSATHSVGTTQYRPKNVVLQYPERTETGFEMRDISVPLITLVPMSMPEVSEVKFRIDLIVSDDGKTLKVGFPNKPFESNNENLNNPNSFANASLEMTLIPNKGTGGLQDLIAAYEQVLRSQLP